MTIVRAAKRFGGRLLIPHFPTNRHVLNHIRWELNAVWVRFNNKINPWWIKKKIALDRQDDVLVNVGCGPFGEEGWVNIDLMRHPRLTLRWDCRRGLPLRDESAWRIRVEHFLEHLDHIEEVPPFLNSCYASLKRGGILRIIVPDAERYLRAYVSGEDRDWEELGWKLEQLPEGFSTRMDIINHVFHQREEHLYAYDYQTLERALRQAGFHKVSRRDFRSSQCTTLQNDLSNHRSYSLYVEAIK